MEKDNLTKILQIVLFLQDEMSDKGLIELDFTEKEIELSKKILRNINWLYDTTIK